MSDWVRFPWAADDVQQVLVADGYQFPGSIQLQPWTALKMAWVTTRFAFQAAAHTRREQRRKDAQ